MADRSDELRKLPQVDRVIARLGGLPHPMAADAARSAIEEARTGILSGSAAPEEDALVERAKVLARLSSRGRLTKVINATGVILHTNLGRAPLSVEAIEAIEATASGYSNLEYDLARGSRGSRYEHATGLLRTITGAEAALVVNNNAAAVLLGLAAIARGREVIISRGELIEIGGGFRIPEILGESGAVLKEVGTTNRTHLRDYERAIGPQTAAIMKVHPSNYRVTGFAASVDAGDLVPLARDRGLTMIHDLGSGLLRRSIGGHEPSWLADEPTVEDALTQGADVVTFSGDKLLGGPQSGIILGRSAAIEKMHRAPLLRAFRIDKSTIAALEATLIAYASGREADLPVWRMALADVTAIEARAVSVRGTLQDAAAKVSTSDGASTTGGGSLPGGAIPTVLLEISPRRTSPDDLIAELLDGEPPIVARIDADRVIVDLRTVSPDDDVTVATSLQRALE